MLVGYLLSKYSYVYKGGSVGVIALLFDVYFALQPLGGDNQLTSAGKPPSNVIRQTHCRLSSNKIGSDIEGAR